MTTCKHCGRGVEQVDGRWIDPEATGDDVIWREVCGGSKAFTAEHEPTSETTPGPWRVEQDAETEWEFGDGGIGYHYRVMDEGDCTVARCYQQPHDTWSAEDNARLIAAAPDQHRELAELLPLLEEMEVAHCGEGAPNPAEGFVCLEKRIEAVRNAIDKATGAEVSA